MLNVLKNSIFKNLMIIIHGPTMILNSNNIKLTFKKLNNISPFICLLGVRLNHKLYSINQIKNLKKISYIENFSILHNSIKTYLKIPYYKLKTKKVLVISK